MATEKHSFWRGDKTEVNNPHYGLYTAFMAETNLFSIKINDALKNYKDTPRWWNIRPLMSSTGELQYSQNVLAQGIWYKNEVDNVLKSIQKTKEGYKVSPNDYTFRYEAAASVFTFQAQIDFLAFLLEKRVLESRSFEVFGLRKFNFVDMLKSSTVRVRECTISIISRQNNPLITFEVKMPY